MKNGWSLSVATTMDGRIHLQKGRPGCGGETSTVHGNSFYSLRTKGLIKQIKYGFPSSEWGLTELANNVTGGE
jgi:hypothetical protein